MNVHNYQPPHGQNAAPNMHQPPRPIQQPYYQTSHAPPSNLQYSPVQHQSNPHYATGAPSTYHPRIGFTRLSTKFHIWNVMSSGGTSILCLGPQPNRDIFYSTKMFSVSRLKIKPGPCESGASPLCAQSRANTRSATRPQSHSQTMAGMSP